MRSSLRDTIVSCRSSVELLEVKEGKREAKFVPKELPISREVSMPY